MVALWHSCCLRWAFPLPLFIVDRIVLKSFARHLGVLLLCYTFNPLRLLP
ncbi:hypothetical protein BZA02_1292 [Ruegeria sp. P4]|nr:hypothetical protein BZA02_1292 [Ruegeria sp. P4]